MSERIYRWDCDKCDNFLVSKTNYPLYFKNDDFTCKSCNSGVMLPNYSK